MNANRKKNHNFHWDFFFFASSTLHWHGDVFLNDNASQNKPRSASYMCMIVKAGHFGIVHKGLEYYMYLHIDYKY